MPTIYENLIAIATTDPAFFPKRGDETDQDYLHRLCGVISIVPEAEWNKLTEESKQWYDGGLDEEANLKAELIVPEGYPPAPTAVRRRVAAPAKPQTVFEAAVSLIPDFASQHAQESDQVFLARLVRELPGVIPAALQEWVTAADGAIDASTPIPLPEGYTATAPIKPAKAPRKKAAAPVAADPTPEPEAPPAAPVVHTEPSNGESQAMHTASDGTPLRGIQLFNARLAAGEVTRRKRTAATGPKKEGAGRRPRVNSTTSLIRDAVTLSPEITVDELVAMLRAAGKDVATSTVSTTRASHLAALRSIQRMGWTPPAQQQPAAEAD